MNEHGEPFASIDVLAKQLGVSVSTLRVWTHKKEIPKDTYIQVGTTYRYRINAVIDALTKKEATAEQDADVMWEGVDLDEDI